MMLKNSLPWVEVANPIQLLLPVPTISQVAAIVDSTNKAINNNWTIFMMMCYV